MKNLLYILLFIPFTFLGQSNSAKIDSLIVITNYHQQEINSLKERIDIKPKMSKTHRIGTGIQLLGLMQTTISLFSIYSFDKAFIDDPILASATKKLTDRNKSVRNAAIGALISSIGLTINLTSRAINLTYRDRTNTKAHKTTKNRTGYSGFDNSRPENPGIYR